MVSNTIKKTYGTRKLRKLLNEYYEGEVLDNLVTQLYPLLAKVGYDGLEQIIGLCNQLAGDHSDRTAVTLLAESTELIDKLLIHGDKELVLNVYALCNRVASDSEGPAVRLLAVSPELITRVGYEGLEQIARLCRQTAREDSFVATRLMGLSPDLIDRVGYDGLEQIARLCRQVASDRRFIAALLEMTLDLIDTVGIDVLEQVTLLSSQVAGYSSTTAVRLLGQSPELIAKAGIVVLEQVVGLCSRVAHEDSFVAARVLDLSPALIDKVSPDCLEHLAELCCLVNKDDSFIAARVLDGSPELVERLLEYSDTELVTTVYAFCTQVARDFNWRTAVRLLGRCPELTERLQRYGDKELVLNVYELCKQVARYNCRTAVSLLEASPDIIGRANYNGLVQVAYKASEIAKNEGEEKATSFVRGESSEYAEFFEAISEGLELRRVKPVLLHYLNALLGYRIEIVDAQGAGATTDGERIFLPIRLKEFEEEDLNFVLYKVLATHEEAHLEYGSFDFELLRVQGVVTKIKEKYGCA